MLYPFFPKTPTPGLEHAIQQNFLDGNGDPAMDTAQYLMQMAQIGPRAQAPEPMELDGGSVIGLTPEMTTRLMEQIQQENQFNEQSTAAQNARRDSRIDGLNETVFRAREALQRKRERDAERRAQQQEPRYFQGPGGQITELTPGMGDAAPTTRQVVEAQPERGPNLQQVEYDRVGPDGTTQRMFRTFNPQTGAMGEEQVLGTAPARAGDVQKPAHVSGKYIDVDPATGQQRQMIYFSDGTTKEMGRAPQGYIYQTDTMGNVIGLNRMNPQDVQAVPAPGPLPQGQQPLQSSLPEGQPTPKDMSAEYDRVFKMLSESNPDFLYAKPEEQQAAVMQYLQSKQAAISGGAASQAPQAGQVITAPDGTIVRLKD